MIGTVTGLATAVSGTEAAVTRTSVEAALEDGEEGPEAALWENLHGFSSGFPAHIPHHSSDDRQHLALTQRPHSGQNRQVRPGVLRTAVTRHFLPVPLGLRSPAHS